MKKKNPDFQLYCNSMDKNKIKDILQNVTVYSDTARAGTMTCCGEQDPSDSIRTEDLE
jgi:hypothetical protein